MVVGCCVCVLLGWLVDEYVSCLLIISLVIGKIGIYKYIYVGVWEVDIYIFYVEDFICMVSVIDS